MTRKKGRTSRQKNERERQRREAKLQPLVESQRDQQLQAVPPAAAGPEPGPEQ